MVKTSFCSNVKAEICRLPLNKHCCAVAEAYGVLLFCNTFSAAGVRIVTESRDFAQRLPKLFKKAFDLEFDHMPDDRMSGLQGSIRALLPFALRILRYHRMKDR